ncbi:MAG: TolC family protein [Bacteroidia bacterium]|nr:TolC family protein [Bacteroidia bacterium]
MSTKSFLLIVLLSLSSFARAQKKWGLQECIDYALKNNLTVQQSALNNKDSKVALNQSKANYLPTVNGFGTNNFNFGRSIDPFTNTFQNQQIRSNNFGVTGSVVLFNGLQNYTSMQQNELLYKASEYDLNQAINNLSLSVANAYLTILLNDEILSSARIQAENTKKQLERTEKLYNAGSVSIGNVLDLKAQYANEQLNITNAQNQVKLAYLVLWQLLELPYDETNTIEKVAVDVPKEEPAISTNALVTSYSARGPEIQSAEIRLLAAQKGLTLAKSGRSPKLTMNGSVNTTYSQSFMRSTGYDYLGTRILYFDQNNVPVTAPYYSSTGTEVTPFNQQLKDNLGKSLGFTLSVPVLNNWQVNNNIQRSKISLERSKLNLNQTRNQVYRTITQAVLDLEAAKARYAAAMNSYEAGNLSYKNAEQRFNAGAMNFTDYTVSKNNFMRAEATMLQAKYEFIFRQRVVDFYNGKPITLQ